MISNGATYDFGMVTTGNTGQFTFTVTNTGAGSATSMMGTGLSAPFAFKGGAYPGTGGTCGMTLMAAGSCTVVVTFSPTAMGLFSSTFTLNYFDGTVNSASSRSIVGTGN